MSTRVDGVGGAARTSIPGQHVTLAQRVARVGQDEMGLMPEAEFSQGQGHPTKAEFEQERERAKSARPARSARRSASSRGKKSNRNKVVRRPATPPPDPPLDINRRAAARIVTARDTPHSGFGGAGYASQLDRTTPRIGGSRMHHGAMMQSRGGGATMMHPPPRLNPAVLASAQGLMDRKAEVAGDGTSRGMSSRASRSYRETMAMLMCAQPYGSHEHGPTNWAAIRLPAFTIPKPVYYPLPFALYLLRSTFAHPEVPHGRASRTLCCSQGVMAEPPRELQETPVGITRTPRDKKLTNDDLLSRNLISGISRTPRDVSPPMDPVDQILMLAGGRGLPRAMGMYEA